MAVVYLHRRKDTNEVFYVGIGRRKKRAFARAGRNPHWHRVVDKYGYDVEIAFDKLSYDESLVIEQELISLIGRSDKGDGPLVNMTDGGEGTLGFEPWNKDKPMSEKSKLKLSNTLTELWKDPEMRAKLSAPKGPHTQEWKDNMSIIMKEKGHKPPQNQSERKWTQQSREKVRNNQTGEGNSNAVLTIEQVKFIKKNYKKYSKECGVTALSKKLGVATATIYAVTSGYNWSWVEID